ncbi:hypothetical protein OG520_40280 (plasmid) [Streptomyces sp. NBC_00984]|uniref:hypothetical protein n=1 Tax=Streptomyces sp. NBC_00984 TaxID=2903700 RepID=UPI002F90C1E9|nr:hypothetical protein OG520_40280 [Streptomyces sp. NBC_00984]
MLAQRLRAAWAASDSPLPLDRLEAKLKERLKGQNVRGLGRTSIGRYMDPGHTPLPDKAVLAALAEIFGVGDDERAQWHCLHTRAKAAQRQRQLQRPVAGGQEASATPLVPHEEVVRGCAELGTITPTAPMAPDTGETDGNASVTSCRPVALARGSDGDEGTGGSGRWDRIPASAKVASAALALLVAGGVLAAAPWDRRDSGSLAVPGRAAGAGPEGTPVSGMLEKGSLGADSRCSVPFQGPEAVIWRVCGRVDPSHVSFALKITNQGRDAITVKVHLEWARASKLHSCPQQPNTKPLRIPAGESVVTDPAQCTVLRGETAFAYQGAGWVFAKDANGGSYRLSPTAHIRPDGVTWQPDLV